MVPVLDGKKFSRDLHESIGQRIRVVSYELLELSPGSSAAITPFDQEVKQITSKGFFLVDRPEESDRTFTDQDGFSSTLLRARTWVWVFEYGELRGTKKRKPRIAAFGGTVSTAGAAGRSPRVPVSGA